MLNAVVLRSFGDELEKLSRRSYAEDFLSGVNPLGQTFEHGLQDARISKQEAERRRAASTAGGFVGGAALMPSLTGGVVEGTKGLVRGGAREGARGALRGLTAPFTRARDAYVGAKGLRALSKSERALTEKERDALVRLSKDRGMSLRRLRASLSGDKGAPSIKREAAALSKAVRDEGVGAAAGVGFGGALGALAASQQYQHGRRAGQQMSADRRRGLLKD